jgi:hypothetical protein
LRSKYGYLFPRKLSSGVQISLSLRLACFLSADIQIPYLSVGPEKKMNPSSNITVFFWILLHGQIVLEVCCFGEINKYGECLVHSLDHIAWTNQTFLI